MKAIIIDQESWSNTNKNSADYSNILMPLLNLPHIMHTLKQLHAASVTEVIVLTDAEISAELITEMQMDGPVQFQRELSLKQVDEDQTDYLILPGNVLLDMDYSQFQALHNAADGKRSRAIPSTPVSSGNSKYFNPVILTKDGLKRETGDKTSLSPQAVLNVCKRHPESQNAFQLINDIYNLNSHRGYWEAHRYLLLSEAKTDVIPGFPLRENVWVDINTRVDPSSTTQGFAILGKNCKIHKDVRFKGFVVIGDHVIIDEATIIEDSVIRSDTFIGSDLHIKNAVVSENKLYRADYDAMLNLEDGWLLGSTRAKQRLVKSWFQSKRSQDDHWGVNAN